MALRWMLRDSSSHRKANASGLQRGVLGQCVNVQGPDFSEGQLHTAMLCAPAYLLLQLSKVSLSAVMASRYRSPAAVPAGS